MESQLHRYEDDPHHNTGLHSVMEGEGDNHHEKKSVLKKVKDKAKKIKNTITKHGHGHEHDDYEEDDETVVDSDVHGAPMVNEVDFISGTALPKQTGLNLENQTRHTPSVKNEVHYDVGDDHGPNVRDDDGIMKTSSPLMEDPCIPRKQEHSNVGGPPTLEDPYIPYTTEEDKSNVVMFKTSPTLEDPYIPNTGKEDKSNVGMFKTSPTLEDPHISYTREEDKSDVGMFKTSPTLEDPYIPNTRKENYSGVGDGGMFKASPALDDPYIPKEEVYSSGIGDFGNAPKTDLLDPLQASTAPISSEQRAKVSEPEAKIGPLADLERDPHAPGAAAPTNYQTKVVDPTGQGGGEAEVAPLLDRLGNLSVDDKSETMPINTGSHDQFAPTDEHFNVDSDKSPESMPQATVAGKISSVTTAIADKATAAKNMVASSLGRHTQEGQEPSKPSAMGSVSEYGHIVAEKLAPVYEKAAGAGSAIMSKVQGGEDEGGEGGVKESDKGVSVQGYLAEKFSPGEEDKELSKVITDAIHRKKEGTRVAVEEQAAEAPVKERVRVEAVCSDEKTAAGVVDRVKGAIGSWLGSKGQQQDYVAAGEGLEKEEGRRMQESSN